MDHNTRIHITPSTCRIIYRVVRLSVNRQTEKKQISSTATQLKIDDRNLQTYNII